MEWTGTAALSTLTLDDSDGSTQDTRRHASQNSPKVDKQCTSLACQAGPGWCNRSYNVLAAVRRVLCEQDTFSQHASHASAA